MGTEFASLRRNERGGTMLEEVIRLLEEVEERVLDGLRHPFGKLHEVEEEQADYDFAVPRVVMAYQLATTLEDRHLLPRVYLLARDLVFPCGRFGISAEVPNDLVKEIRAIACEGRELGISAEVSLEDRLERQRLFSIAGETCAVQVRHPERGCSASLCSNCDEPSAFADQECRNCGFGFIGPFDTPSKDRWDVMSSDERTQVVQSTYGRRNRGRLPIGCQ